MQGSPSQVKGVGFRSLSCRGSWVRIPPPAPSRCVWFSSSNFGSKNPKTKTKISAFKNPRTHKGHVNKQTNTRLRPTHKTKPTQHTTTPKRTTRITIFRPPKRFGAVTWSRVQMRRPPPRIIAHNRWRRH